MAEAFPEQSTTSELHEDSSRKVISVLLLASRWQFDTYGLSTINKSLVNNLRLVDPEAKTIKITCVVVEEDGKITDVDKKDAENYGVQLRGAKRPKGKKGENKPELEWLDESTAAYYLHLQDQPYDFIIGHAPYLAYGCFNFKDIYKWKEVAPKVILMVHGLPKKESGYIDDDMLEDWLNEADIVFTVGKAVESELVPYLAGINAEKRPIHKMYIPTYPVELLNVAREEKGEKVEGTQNITMMSAEFKDLKITGLDFPLAMNATIGAAEHIRDFDGVRMNLTMLAAHENDRAKWKEESDKIFQRKNVTHVGLSSHAESPTDINKLQSHLKRSTLFLLPLRPDSPLFGTEALGAIAAGVPVLVSRYSGLARFLREIVGDESVVYETKSQSATDTWKDRILERLLRPEEPQKTANKLREQFLLDTNIAETHLEFINTIASKFIFIIF